MQAAEIGGINTEKQFMCMHDMFPLPSTSKGNGNLLKILGVQDSKQNYWCLQSLF